VLKLLVTETSDCRLVFVCCVSRESVKSCSQSVLPKQNQDSTVADSMCPGLNTLSRWSSNAESMSLSDTLDEDKPTSKLCSRFIIAFHFKLFIHVW